MNELQRNKNWSALGGTTITPAIETLHDYLSNNYIGSFDESDIVLRPMDYLYLVIKDNIRSPEFGKILKTSSGLSKELKEILDILHEYSNCTNDKNKNSHTLKGKCYRLLYDTIYDGTDLTFKNYAHRVDLKTYNIEVSNGFMQEGEKSSDSIYNKHLQALMESSFYEPTDVYLMPRVTNPFWRTEPNNDNTDMIMKYLFDIETTKHAILCMTDPDRDIKEIIEFYGNTLPDLQQIIERYAPSSSELFHWLVSIDVMLETTALPRQMKTSLTSFVQTNIENNFQDVYKEYKTLRTLDIPVLDCLTAVENNRTSYQNAELPLL